jgi:hypothetical protein
MTARVPSGRVGIVVALRLPLAILGLAAVVLVSVAVWVSMRAPMAPAASGQRVGVGTGGVAPTAATGSGVGAPGPDKAYGQGQGYRADVQLIHRRDDGLVQFEVILTTEGTPASAPSADAQLAGAGSRSWAVKLDLVGAGRWVSEPVRLPAGRYLMIGRFHRQGSPVTIPVRLDVR